MWKNVSRIHFITFTPEEKNSVFAQVSSKLLTKPAFFMCSSQKHAAPRGQRNPRLVIEEYPLTCETLTNEVVKELLEKVMEFCGFLFVTFCGGELCFWVFLFFFQTSPWIFFLGCM